MFLLKNRFHIIFFVLLGVFAACNVAASSLKSPRSLLEEDLFDDKEQAGEDEDDEALLPRSLGALSSLSAAMNKLRSKKPKEREVAQKFAYAILDATMRVSAEVLDSDFIDRSTLTADQLAQLNTARQDVDAINTWLVEGRQVVVPIPGLGPIFTFLNQILGLGTGGLGGFLASLQIFLCAFLVC